MKLCCRYQNRCCGYDRCQRYMEPNDLTMEQLKNMQSLLYLSIEHLNKLKGVNNNGRNLQNSKNN